MAQKKLQVIVNHYYTTYQIEYQSNMLRKMNLRLN